MKGFGQDERSKSCKIEILSPDEKEQVTESASVKGTVQKPAENNHLWLLAHRKGLALWWPQPTGDIVTKDGKWSASVYYETPSDIGSQFEIMAIIVNDEVNAQLRRWLDKSNAAGNYPPILLPQSICRTTRTVIRTR